MTTFKNDTFNLYIFIVTAVASYQVAYNMFLNPFKDQKLGA